MFDHVLVVIDASERSREALEYAVEEFADARITVLHVVDPQQFYAATGIEGGITTSAQQIQSTLEEQAVRLLRDAKEVANEHGIEVETAHTVGRVANTIVEYAEENDVEHIVIGSHGRSGASRILLGSVAETVVRRAPVPVTVVR